MTIVSKRLAPGDTAAHPLSAVPLLVYFATVWGDDGSGVVRLGDATVQGGFAPYNFPLLPGAGALPKPYDLSTIYYKLTANGDAVCILYGTP